MGELIVVVDDDEANRSVAEQVLTDAGFRVRTAAGGDELPHLLMDERPSLVILDGGLSAAARSQVPRTIPIIVLSAAYGVDIQQYATAIDAKGWLRKPFDIDELVAVVRAHTQRV